MALAIPRQLRWVSFWVIREALGKFILSWMSDTSYELAVYFPTFPFVVFFHGIIWRSRWLPFTMSMIG